MAQRTDLLKEAPHSVGRALHSLGGSESDMASVGASVESVSPVRSGWEVTRHLHSECSIIQGLKLVVRKKWSPRKRESGKREWEGEE